MNLNVVRTLSIKATTEGMPQTAAALKAVATAQEGVTKASERVAAAQERATKAATAATAAQERAAKVAATQGASQEKIEKATARATAAQERATKAAAAAAAAQERLAASEGLLTKAKEHGTSVTDKSIKRQLSLADAVEKLRLRTDADYRVQQQFTKGQDLLNRAHQQGTISTQQYTHDLARLHAHYRPIVAANDNVQSSFQRTSQAMAAIQGSLGMFASRLGPVGVTLSAMGPLGIAAAVGIGAVAVGLHQAASAALALADRAGKLRDFAETTGFSVIQLQALEKAGAQVGVSSESVTRALEKFSVVMVDVRESTGDTYDKLFRADAGLAKQVSRATDLAEAWDLVSKSIKNLPVDKANEIARAFFGRAGVEQTRLMRAGAEAGGIAGLVTQLKEVDRILPEQAKRWDDLGDSIAENMKAGRQNVVSVFADPVLVALNELSAGFLVLSRIIKEGAPSIAGDSGWLAWAKSWTETIGRIAPMNALMLWGLEKLREQGRLEIAAAAPMKGAPVRFAGGADFDAHRVATLKETRGETIRVANAEKQRMDALGSAATAQEKYNLKVLELNALVAKYPPLQAEANRQLADFKIEQANSAASRRIGLLGDMASADEIVAQKQREINAAIKDGAQFTTAEIAAIKEKTRVQAEAAGPAAQIQLQRQAIFLLEEEAQIRQQLLAWGVRWNTQKGEEYAQQLRINNQLKEIKDIAETSLSGFWKDRANGVTALDAMVNQAKRLQDIFIDMAAKRVVSAAMTSVFGGALDVASPTAGATAAAGIWTAAGMAFNAAFLATVVEGAGILGVTIPAAAQSLPVAGATTGLEVWAGGKAASMELEAGGILAGLAINGPLVLLFAAIAALAAVVGFGGGAEKERQRKAIQGYRDRATLAQTDTSTLSGALTEFDLRAASERAALPGGGMTKSGTGLFGTGLFGRSHKTQELIELERAQAAERIRVIEDFGKRAVEAEKQAEKDRLAVIEDFGRAMNEVKGLSFLNEFADLFKQIATYRTAGADPMRLQEFLKLSAQQIVDSAELTGTAFDDLIVRFPELTGVIHASTAAIEKQIEEQKRLADQQNDIARTITNYLNDLQAGSSSGLSPGNRLAAAQLAYNSQFALAQGGNVDAQTNFPKYAEDLRTAAKDMFGSSLAYQQIFSQIVSQGLSLPAVVQATDPVVQAVRDVITAIGLTTTAVGGVLTSAQLASLGLSRDATTGNIVTISQQQKTALDLIQSATAATNANTLSQVNLQNTQNSLIGSANALQTTANSLATEIKGFSQTSKEQLVLLTTNLTGSVTIPIQVNPAGGGGTDPNVATILSRTSQFQAGVSPSQLNQIIPASVSTTLIAGIEKIVINTASIAFNTAEANQGAGRFYRYGIFAQGGVIPPHGLALVSEHSPGGGRFMRAGPEPITVSPYAPSFANDNSALLARIDRLTAEVASLKRELRYNSDLSAEGNRINRDGHAGTRGEVMDQTVSMKTEMRQDRNNPKNSKAA